MRYRIIKLQFDNDCFPLRSNELDLFRYRIWLIEIELIRYKFEIYQIDYLDIV